MLFRLISAQPDPAMHSVISLTDQGAFGDRLRGLGVRVWSLGLQRGKIPSPLAIVKLRRWLRQIDPNVVQTWMYHADLLGGIAARLARLPVCWGLHHTNLAQGKNKELTIMVAKANAMFSKFIPNRIVSCSKRGIDVHRDIGYADKFDYIPNGVDLSRVVKLDPNKRELIRTSLGIPVGAKVIGHVGRSDPQKGHETLFATFAKVAEVRPEVFMLLAGAGLQHGDPYLENLLMTSGAARWSSRVVALGQRDDVPELMNSMDVFVLSSVGEAFPVVLTEAMACGIPCVTTDVGDSGEIVGDTGWVRQPGDVDGLARDILAAFSEAPHQRIARVISARQRIVDNFSVERMVNAYDDVWSQVGVEG